MAKQPDRLTQINNAALAAGMSYGKYMVMHNYNPPIYADTVADGVSVKVCKQCGKPFSVIGRPHNMSYCCYKCQDDAGKERYRARYKRRKAMKQEENQ